MTDWNIRLARPEDAEHIPAIEAAAARLFADIAGLKDMDPEDLCTVDQLTKFISKGHCLVAQIDDKVIGFLASQPFSRELHIWEMDVAPEHQRQGIGAALIRACQIDARNSGFSALTLTTFRDVPWNAPFYSQLGFSEIANIETYPRLEQVLTSEQESELPADRRCA
ncbi:GNAT family N-acetyltransferase [Qipengyuania sp. DGS5-3]|uniref:GNAT family N-acetyltransferase n=1 Tax=Qipengyuania sp. DGS5-3 TaxID=3349632 RepID=UPI0036D23900